LVKATRRRRWTNGKSRELDVADLDFGLYRILHLKRGEVHAFLNEQLPAEVEQTFEAIAGTERESLERLLQEHAKQVRTSVADDAILPTGEPNPKYAETKAVREYSAARSRLESAGISESQRSEVYNLLYAFFSRYYDGGDFIARRFFGARPAYALPYNGEEVFFHWANRDQYYVKTGEAFRDYAFVVPTVSGEYRVRFEFSQVTTHKDNVKGNTRFFFPVPERLGFNPDTRTCTVPFEYRLPTEAEVARYGRNSKGQEAILDEALSKILRAVPEGALGAALTMASPTGREAEDEEPPTLLRRRLSHFTRKQTSDYFVHRDLHAFLKQELEFFARDQVVHELDLEGDLGTKRQVLHVFRKLAGTVITFLAQIEDAERRLFEKRKFVLRSDYLVPIRNVPATLWPEVLSNQKQLDEWKELFGVDPRSDFLNMRGEISEHVSEQHPTLVVDTRHYSPDFAVRLLESVEDLDEQTDGVLVQAENFQEFEAIGDVAPAYLKGLARARQGHLREQARQIREYGRDAVNEAMSRADHFGLYGYAAVKQIVQKQAQTPGALPADPRELVEVPYRGPNVSVQLRSLDDYARLSEVAGE
jgi:adenine-specific DNA-methyltransferase